MPIENRNKRVVAKDDIRYPDIQLARNSDFSSLSAHTPTTTNSSSSLTHFDEYKNIEKLNPVMGIEIMSAQLPSSFIDLKGASFSPIHNNLKTPLSAPMSETVAKMWNSSRSKSSDGAAGKPQGKIRMEDISKPYPMSEEGAGGRWFKRDRHYPLAPLWQDRAWSQSSNYSTPSLDTQHSSASDSSPATSFIDMSYGETSGYTRTSSDSVSRAAQTWRSRLRGSKDRVKNDDTGASIKPGVQRSNSLGISSKISSKASPARPSLDRMHYTSPSFDGKPSSFSSPDTNSIATRPTFDIFPCDPFARPAPPNAESEPMLSLEDRAKVDANYAILPEDYQERMDKAPRPKGRPDRVLTVEVDTGKLKPDKNRFRDKGKEKEKEPRKLTKEETVKEKVNAKDQKKGGKDSAGTPRQDSASLLSRSQKKAPFFDVKQSAVVEVMTPVTAKLSKDKAKVPPLLPLYNDNLHTTVGLGHGTSSLSSYVQSPGASVVLNPYTPLSSFSPPGPEGPLCFEFTPDDLYEESDAEKPPPVPPKDKGKRVKATTSSSKSSIVNPVVGTRKTLRHAESLGSMMTLSTASIYSEESYREEEKALGMVIPRRQL